MKRLGISTLLSIVLAVCMLVPGTAFADVNDFTVTDFSADYYLSKGDPQGQLHVVEKINVDFTDYNHGILRALPKSYKNLPLNIHVNRVSSESGAPATYTISSDSNGNEIVKIGDPNMTVTGAQEYIIDYTMQNVVTFYGDHDELYWDVNGTDWSQDFTKVTARLHLPPELQFLRQSVCYEGPQGSSDHNCQLAQNGSELTVTAGPVYRRDTLTFVSAFPKGYFQSPTTWDYIVGYIPGVLEFTVPFLLIGGAGFLWWWKRGRDAKGTGVIVPEYDAPDNLSPLEAGALVDFKVDSRDLTATIIDLAIRKYLRIVEVDDKQLLVLNKKSFNLELLNKDWSKLNAWEQELLSGMFGVLGEHTTVKLADLANKLQAEAKSIKRLVVASLADRGYFNADPTKYLKLSLGAILIIAIAVPFHIPLAWEGSILWGIIAGGIVFGICYHFLPARTSKGVAANEHIMGLKMYLEVAEKDRLKMLQSPDAPYAEHTNAPEQTVELFEKLLPYAIVLKVEKEWAKKFKDLYRSPPDWYAGNYAAFSTGYLVGALGGGFNSAMVSSFSPQSSGGGSGFGGGFSGGGGGGGGGGGW